MLHFTGIKKSLTISKTSRRSTGSGLPSQLSVNGSDSTVVNSVYIETGSSEARLYFYTTYLQFIY